MKGLALSTSVSDKDLENNLEASNNRQASMSISLPAATIECSRL